jgi:hypothetical protein
MTVDDYFEALQRSLRANPTIARLGEPLVALASDDFNGLLKARVFFWDDSFLDLYEVVSTEIGYPIRVSYAYTYVRNGSRIFRYDNAPHHPEIITHPHHKHIGQDNRLAPADQPTLNQVMSEVAGWLDNTPG